jgi:hypothetical protein
VTSKGRSRSSRRVVQSPPNTTGGTSATTSGGKAMSRRQGMDSKMWAEQLDLRNK